MRLRPLFPFAPVAALLSAGCLPSRDNPFDTTRKPVAALDVVDRTDPAGTGCLPDDDAVFETVLVATVRQCLALDARRSSDPNDDPLLYTFTWSTSASGTRQGFVPPLEDVATGIITLRDQHETFLRDRGPAATVHFHVSVRDPDGGRDSASSDLTLLNTPPEANASPSRVFALRSAFVDGTDSIVVPFTGTAFDADGHPIEEWCWSFSDIGTLCSGVPDAPEFTRTIALRESASLRAYLRVFDGRAWSQADTTWALVDDPVWALDPRGRVFRLRQSDPIGPEEGPHQRRIASLFLPPAYTHRKPILAVQSRMGATSNVHLASWPDATRVGARETVPDAGDLAFSPDGSLLWVFADVLGTPPTLAQVRTFAVDTAAGLLTTGPGVFDWVEVPIDGDAGSTTRGHFIDVDSVGSAWVSRRAGTGVVSIFADGTAAGSHEVGDGKRVHAIASRPLTTQTWVVAGSVAPGVSSSLLVFEGTSDALARQVDLTPLTIGAMTWIDSSYFWVSIIGRGLLLVDAARLEESLASTADAQSAFESAIELEVPLVQDAFTLRADPLTGACWSTSGSVWGDSVEIARTTLQGEVALSAATSDGGRFVDPLGAFWHAATLLEKVDAQSVYGMPGDSFSVSPGAAVDVDASTGVAWTGGAQSGALTLVGADGETQRIETSVRIGNAFVPLDRFHLLRLVPGGTTAWVVPGTIGLTPPEDVQHGLYRYDLSTTPPTATLVLSSSALASYGVESFLASAPGKSIPTLLAPTRTGAVWMQRGTNVPFGQNSAEVVAIGDDGNELGAWPVPLSEGPGSIPMGLGFARRFNYHAAPSLRDGRLCLATLDSSVTPRRVRLRWISPDGTASSDFADFPTPTNDWRIGAVSVSRYSDTQDACWFAIADRSDTFCPWTGDTQIHAFVEGVGSIRSQSIAGLGDIGGLLPATLDDLWVASRSCEADRSRIFRSRHAGGNVWSNEFFGDEERQIYPLSPEASRPHREE